MLLEHSNAFHTSFRSNIKRIHFFSPILIESSLPVHTNPIKTTLLWGRQFVSASMTASYLQNYTLATVPDYYKERPVKCPTH